MKFAFLSADFVTLGVARAMCLRPDTEIACVTDLQYSANSAVAEVLGGLNSATCSAESWEDLLEPGLVDGVIVAPGTDEDRTSEQLRKFAQVGVPVLFSHPIVDSMLLYYELDMIRQDTRALIVPALPTRRHPAIEELLRRVTTTESVLGPLEQVICERPLYVRTKRAVQMEFSRDVDLLRRFCGELNQLGAMGTAGEESAYGNLSVQMTGPSHLLARWSTQAPQSGESAEGRLVLTGGKGRVWLEMPEAPEPWELHSGTDEPPLRFEPWDPGALLLDDFCDQINGNPPAVDAADLLDAARAAELTATISRSLARRRTIDLYFEEHSEANTFKGKMAVAGCLLLVLGLLALPVLALLAKANMPGIWLWAWIFAGLFGGFALLQLLVFVSKK